MLQSFVWNQYYETGLPEVDQQHHRLVDLINLFGQHLAENEIAMLMGLIGLGVCLLALGWYFTMRESASHLARGQARAFIGGLALIALPLSLAWAPGSASLRLAATTVVAALLPFPFGYAISRYEAADIDASLRKVLAQALYLTLGSASIFWVIYALRDALGLPDALKYPTVIFAGVYGTLLVIDPLRAMLEQRLHTLIVSQRIDWEGLGREYAQRIAAQRNDEGIAGAVASAIRSGLGETGVGILVAEGDGFALVEAVRARGFVDTSLAEALADWSTDAVSDLNRLAELPADLRARGAQPGAAGAVSA